MNRSAGANIAYNTLFCQPAAQKLNERKQKKKKVNNEQKVKKWGGAEP